MEIKSCEYNWDYCCVDATFKNGNKTQLLCSKIEDSLNLTMITSSRLDWLLENNIKYYVELVMSGEMQQYLDNYQTEYYDERKVIREQLEKQYDKSTAEAMTHEFMMYRDET